jgi:hypothetical protein
MWKLSEFTNLRNLCLFFYEFPEVNWTYSIPPLHKLELVYVKISINNIQRLFQGVASTLVHLTIYNTVILGAAKELDLPFTALESCKIDPDEYRLGYSGLDNDSPSLLNVDFYEILLKAISGSEETLKVFISPNKKLNANHYFLQNAQVLEFADVGEVEFMNLMLNNC